MFDSLQPREQQYARPPCPSPEFTQTHVHCVMPSNHLIPCRPLLLLPLVLPSIRVFSSESFLPIRWPEYWSFSFRISPSNEYLGLISFRMDWLDFLAVQGTLKSLFQHHSSKTSILNSDTWGLIQWFSCAGCDFIFFCELLLFPGTSPKGFDN